MQESHQEPNALQRSYSRTKTLHNSLQKTHYRQTTQGLRLAASSSYHGPMSKARSPGRQDNTAAHNKIPLLPVDTACAAFPYGQAAVPGCMQDTRSNTRNNRVSDTHLPPKLQCLLPLLLVFGISCGGLRRPVGGLEALIQPVGDALHEQQLSLHQGAVPEPSECTQAVIFEY